MYILDNTFGFKVGDSVIHVQAGNELAIKQSGALRRKRAQISGQNSSIQELNKEEMQQLKRNHPEELGLAMGLSIGPGIVFSAIFAMVGGLIGSAVQTRKTAIGCRIKRENGDYADLLCSQREFDAMRKYFAGS